MLIARQSLDTDPPSVRQPFNTKDKLDRPVNYTHPGRIVITDLCDSHPDPRIWLARLCVTLSDHARSIWLKVDEITNRHGRFISLEIGQR